MELLVVRLFCIIAAMGFTSSESLYYKLPKDRDPAKEIRGNSFGLENFLLQAYKDVDSVNVDNDPPVKRTREKDNYKKKEAERHRGQTYGLENLAPSLYHFGQPSLVLSDFITDSEPNDQPKWVASQPLTPKVSENERRNKVRKSGKHVVRRPVTKSTEAPNPSTELIINLEELEKTDLETKPVQDDHQRPLESKTGLFVAEASYVVPKTQEIPISEKDSEQPLKQRPRKRVTMRRRKKPNHGVQNGDKAIRLNEPGFPNEVTDNYEVLKESESIAPLSTSTSTSTTTTSTTTSTTTTTTAPITTTIRARTDKERPNRKKPGGFRRPASDEQQFLLTTSVYRNDLEPYESNTPTTNTPEIIEYSEEPYTRTTSTTSHSTSSEETSAADLKTFLKQQKGPLSLSELLQTQNLSLADFLKNRKEAALLLSGRGSTTQKPDSREYSSREYSRTNYNFKNRPFTRNKQDPERDDSRSNERTQSTESTTTTDRYTYNGFVPKKPRVRHGQLREANQTVKSNSGSEEKSNESRDGLIGSQENKRSDSPSDKSINQLKMESGARPNRVEVKNIPKRFNDLRLKLRIHRRKYNPHSTTNSISQESKTETSTTPATITAGTQTAGEKFTTTEEIPTTKKLSIRIPFKSTNNPELSLILPSKDKSEEKTEKREKYSNYSSRLHISKKSNQDKDDTIKETNNTVDSTTTKFIVNETILPLDDIEMDEVDKDATPEPKLNKEDLNENKEKTGKIKIEVVGRIPLPNEMQKYETKDEILELLKPGSSSDRLQRILESRNMTVKELLENREKSSLQTNFTQLFNRDDLHQQKRNEIRTTTTSDPTFKVFQSLPDFHPIHRNLYQKNVKDLKSNSYPDSAVDESKSIPVKAIITPTTYEPRESKKLSNVVEVRKKLQLNSDSESRDSLEGNDGLLEKWNTREKVLLYNMAFTTEKKPLPTLKSNVDFSVNDNTENNLEESDIILLETIKRSQDANRKLKSNINEILQEQSQVKDIKSDIDKSFIPPAVRSAIIASSVVLGLAMFVFVAIFAACGWKQRQIRLRARSSILNDALAKTDSEKKVQRTSALSPVFKQTSIYKKSLEVDNESSSGASISSNASSYLWNTLKNTFAGRNTTLKNRLDKEGKTREDRLEGLKTVLRSHETRRSDILVEEDGSEETFSKPLRKHEERYSMRKNEYIKRSPSFTSSNHFSSCTHGH